jgi:hypothetical protein
MGPAPAREIPDHRNGFADFGYAAAPGRPNINTLLKDTEEASRQ